MVKEQGENADHAGSIKDGDNNGLHIALSVGESDSDSKLGDAREKL
jgi:hypothetical protein